MQKSENVNPQITNYAYAQLNFAKLQRQMICDLNKSLEENNVFLKKYKIKDIHRYLNNPDKPQSQKVLREISKFFYAASPHYRRLITFFATLPTYNYVIKSIDDITKDNYKNFEKEYFALCKKYEKYRFKKEVPKMMTTTFLEGVYYGIVYENKDSTLFRQISSEYATITSVEDGVFRFSFDLNYFNGKNSIFLSEYGEDFINAYNIYKGNQQLNIEPHREKRWFEPKNQICIKLDEEVNYSIPAFAGLFVSIMELDNYKELQKDKAILDNYRLIHYKIPVDSDGVPRMSFDQAKEYYDLTAASLPEGIGLTMSPFEADNFTLRNTSNDDDFLENATKDLFANAGLNPLLFGLGNNPTSQTLTLSVKSDEAWAFKILKQISNAFNVRLKKSNPKFNFEIYFLEQSVFNKSEVSDMYLKAAQYGCPTKLFYTASLGLNPVDNFGMSVLENDIFKIPTERFNHPLISSNTLSNGGVEEDGGRPSTNNPSDNTEKNIDNNNIYK